MSALKPYWQLERFARYASELVRYYSRRSDFTTWLTTSIDTACVIPSRKQVLINPEWERCDREDLSRVQVSGHERLVLTIDGLAAHEAAHIRFSGDWPGGLLGQLVNALEDERIERLQEADFPLQRAFDFLGDYTLLADDPEEAFFTARAGVLLWRFQHDFPHKVWSTDEEVWDEVKPLVEAAWVAPDTDEVIALAREIMEIFGLDEDTPEDPFLLELGASGDGEAAPVETPKVIGGGIGAPPRAPRDDTEAFDDLEERLELARPLAAQLSGILKVPRPRSKVHSRSRGRLNVQRVVRGQERPFEKRQKAEARARRIFVVQDVSSSMGCFVPEHPHYHALLTSLALELATARYGIPFELVTFDDETTVVRPFGMEGGEALLKVASVASKGGTILADAIEQVAAQARDDDLVFVLCDGSLGEADAWRCRHAARRMTGTLLPILVGESGSRGQLETVFGLCYEAPTAGDIPRVVKRALMAAEAAAI